MGEGRTAWSAGRVTIMDVAHAAGVSRQTVSNVVNRPERVRPDTLARVQCEIERLGYRPSVAAQSLRAQRAGAVGIELNALGPGRSSDVLYPFLLELVLAAPAHGSHVVPFASDAHEPILEGYQEMTRTHLVDAFVLADTHPGDLRPPYLQQAGVPFVSFGRVWDDPSFTAWADVDGEAGVALAVRHLAEVGYREVGFLGWPAGSVVGDARRAGWARAVAELGLPGATHEAFAPQDVGRARAAARPLVRALGRGAALVCATDALALGALQAVQDCGLQPGADVGVVGFDDSPLARAHDLTTLRQPLREIADHLLTLLPSAHARAGRMFLPELVIRSTTTR